MHKLTLGDLIRKYDVPVPRYTSYPTLPYWDVENFSGKQWIESVKRCFDETNSSKGISLYVHLPFCESLCTYCACNTRITKNHAVEERYIRALLEEWRSYRSIMNALPLVRELHLGGGTPTFFSPSNLRMLLENLLKDVVVHPEKEFSFEGHPNNTTPDHLRVLYDAGFRRVSYGVQDLDSTVQRAINRIQPPENLARVTNASRDLGYTSVGFDLVYGLPYQTVASIRKTIEYVVSLRPDRIAFYSYAHVPWMRPGQRGYEDADLPVDTVKRSLYETGRNLLHEAGYLDIGVDHFALPHDPLALALREGRLHRNFMGYTVSSTELLIGLGTSAISDAKYAYAQNEKKVEVYEGTAGNKELPVVKGHIQSADDMLVKQCILDIACRGRLSITALQKVADASVLDELDIFRSEGIIEVDKKGLTVTEIGRIFIRNICKVFDLHLRAQKQVSKNLFSKAI